MGGKGEGMLVKKKSALGPAGLRRETFSTEGQPPDRVAQAQYADHNH